ncbi:MAG: helix-turn-helix domain-containing protein [Deltaproteobacteria bacterium]|nr:helix-turn-helix domain-containing protein [Deltaproteobacteria bacterium]
MNPQENAASFRLKAGALRELRRRLGLTQAELADTAGVSRRTIQTAENGGAVAAWTARALCEVLEVPLARLRASCPVATRERLLLAGLAPASPPRPYRR